jgi:hypothetical protein
MSTVPVFMSDKRFDEISNRVLKSYPNACILYIDEVINPELEARFLSRMSKKDYKIESMFHGTRECNIDSIVKNGFDPTMNSRAAYGYGVYFARDARYSSDYMTAQVPGNHTFMFLCDVLVGTLGMGHKKDAPGIDNNCNNDKSIITTVYDDGAFPRFIIAFHKEAR